MSAVRRWLRSVWTHTGDVERQRYESIEEALGLTEPTELDHHAEPAGPASAWPTGPDGPVMPAEPDEDDRVAAEVAAALHRTAVGPYGDGTHEPHCALRHGAECCSCLIPEETP